jgi:hypothetical protein
MYPMHQCIDYRAFPSPPPWSSGSCNINFEHVWDRKNNSSMKKKRRQADKKNLTWQWQSVMHLSLPRAELIRLTVKEIFISHKPTMICTLGTKDKKLNWMAPATWFSIIYTTKYHKPAVQCLSKPQQTQCNHEQIFSHSKRKELTNEHYKIFNGDTTWYLALQCAHTDNIQKTSSLSQ